MHELLLDVKGQSSASSLLNNIYTSQRIPNAILLTGTEGVGKFYSAIQFLKMINGNSEIINQKISNLAEPYVKLIRPLPRGKSETNFDLPLDKLSQEDIDSINEQIKQKSNNPYYQIKINNANNIKINSIREINKFLALNYNEINYRGIILIDAHKMSTEAQNAFLKNLEEPPENAIFLLLSDQPELLLSTIKSRCWTVNFAPLSNFELKQILLTKFNYSEETEDAIEEILPWPNGSATKAVTYLETNFEKIVQKTISVLRYSLAGKYFTASKEFSSLLESSSEIDIKNIIDLIIMWFNDTLKMKYNINGVKFKNYTDTLEKYNSRFYYFDINEIVNNLNRTKNAIDNNVNLNLIMMKIIFDISSIGMKTKWPINRKLIQITSVRY